MKLGKLTPRIDPRVPMFDALLAGAAPAFPAAVDWTTKLTGNPVFCNDTLSCCTISAIAHVLRIWTSNVWGQEIDIPDALIQSAYFGLTGGADTGLIETDVLAFWNSQGIALPANQYETLLSGWATIDPIAHTHIKASVAWFGAAYVGFNLPAYVEGLGKWDGPATTGPVPLPPDQQPGSWGGHAVPIVAYDSEGVTVLSWGQQIRASWRFLSFYMDEAHAPVSRTWLDTSGTAPSGLDLGHLEAAMRRLTWAG